MTRKLAIKPDNIQITYSRSPNLKRYAHEINSILPTTTQTFSTMLAMKAWRCLTWPHMNTSQVISNKDNHSYPIRGIFHCKSSDVIYVMACNVCNIQYVGETSNTMDSRCRGRSIRTKKDHPVAIHYRSYNHTIDALLLHLWIKKLSKIED